MQEQKRLLQGQRFTDEALKKFEVPVEELPKRPMYDSAAGESLEVIDFEDEAVLKMITGFIKHFKEHHVPRFEELKRYYDGNNNIKYRPPKAKNRADNRIASNYAKFNVTFKRGVILGNPVEYTGEKTLVKKINEFSSTANEEEHNQKMTKNLLIYGKAHELLFRDEHGQENVKTLDPRRTFIIYDTSLNRRSVCGVRFFDTTFNDKTTSHVEVYANDGFIYYWKADENDEEKLIQEKEPEQSYFDVVQINEWNLEEEEDEESAGDYENVLDIIDAYDLSQSEMANFQQDMSEAMLVIKGNPDTFRKEDGSVDTEGLDYTEKHRTMILGDKKIYEGGQGETVAGAEPDAYYLTKEYDTQGVESYNNRLIADLLRFTNLIDFTDENLGGNQSGIGFRFKGWGSDNDRVNKERAIKKGIMRRLRLLGYSWAIKDRISFRDSVRKALSGESRQDKMYKAINEIGVKFTPNVPQSDKEIMEVIAGMTGIVSDQTIFETAARLTGVDPEEEESRITKETAEKTNVYDFQREPEQPIDEVGD